jgi:dTMP kinase
MRGAFITLEGTEGVGKSTNLEFTRGLIEEHGHHVVTTREPGGTKLGERIRELVLRSKRGSLSALTETLLMFAARAHHVERVIKPALERGDWVLCDRFSDATRAYQGGGRGGDPKLIDQLTKAVQGDLEPDLTILLDAPLGVGLGRLGDRPRDHFEQEGLTFFGRVRTEYLEIAAHNPARVKLVDAAQTIDDVQRSIRAIIESFVAHFDAGHNG